MRKVIKEIFIRVYTINALIRDSKKKHPKAKFILFKTGIKGKQKQQEKRDSF